MKITINTDTNPHTIEVHGKATLGELIAFLSQYYPDFTWKDVHIGEKSFLSAPVNTGQQWWGGTQTIPGVNPSPWGGTGSPIIYGTGTTGASSIGSCTSGPRDSKAAGDLFESMDNMGIHTKQ